MTTLSDRVRVIPSATRSRALQFLSSTALLLDLFVISIAVLVALRGRRELGFFPSTADLSTSLGVIGPLMTLAWVGTIALMGGYRAEVFGSSTEEYKRVLSASLLTSGVIGVGCYLAQYQLSRGFFLLLFLVGVPGLLVSRFVLRRVIHGARRRGSLLQRVVIAGSLSHIDEIASVLRRESWLGYDVVGVVTPPAELAEETRTGIPVLGNADDVVSVAAMAGAETIVFAGGALGSAQQLREIIWELEHDDYSVVVAPSVSEISSERITMRPVGGLPLMHIDPPTRTNTARIGKRLFDIAGAGIALLLASPVLVFCAARIWVHDRGPILFRQTRIGKDGVEFRCWKLRTMVLDAESLLAALKAEMAHEGGLFKVKEDPRITGPGRWMRRFSFDELPQLVNVLRGEMSLVGPRPPLPSEVLAYEQQTRRRLRVRPGMTGLWQVSGRSELTWDEAIRLDLYYVDNWSIVQDIGILARTVGAVTSSRGAY